MDYSLTSEEEVPNAVVQSLLDQTFGAKLAVTTCGLRVDAQPALVQ